MKQVEAKHRTGEEGQGVLKRRWTSYSPCMVADLLEGEQVSGTAQF